jgi:hypothetical protein
MLSPGSAFKPPTATLATVRPAQPAPTCPTCPVPPLTSPDLLLLTNLT